MRKGVLGVVAIAVWVGLALVASLRTGWVHVPLAVGVTLIAMQIVTGRDGATR